MTEDSAMAAKKRGKKPAAVSEADPPPEPALPVSVPEPSDDSPPVPVDEDASERERGRLALCVAGLVASAGGLDAFKKFFGVMPADSGIAFVLVPHWPDENAFEEVVWRKIGIEKLLRARVLICFQPKTKRRSAAVMIVFPGIGRTIQGVLVRNGQESLSKSQYPTGAC